MTDTKCPKCGAEMENQRTATNNRLWHRWECKKCGFKE